MEYPSYLEISIAFISKPEEVNVPRPALNAFEYEVGEKVVEGGPTKIAKDKKEGE